MKKGVFAWFLIGLIATSGLTCSAPKSEIVPTDFVWQSGGDTLALLFHGKVVWQFNYAADQTMPYFHPVALPGGSPLTWLAPDDHPWHYGFWFAWKYLNGVNYWEIHPEKGRQEGITNWTDVNVAARRDFSAAIELKLSYREEPNAKPILFESRTIQISAPAADGSFHFDWELLFFANEVPVMFERTPISGEPNGKSWGGYAGLTWRFADGFSDWQVINLEGLRDMSCHGASSMACDFSGIANEQLIGVAILDDPENLNSPTPWYVTLDSRTPFACLIAAPIFNRGFLLKAGESFKLRYRTIVHPGRWDSEQLGLAQASYREALKQSSR